MSGETAPQQSLKVNTATGKSQRAAAEYVNAVRLIHNSGAGRAAASMVRDAAEDALETVLETAGDAARDIEPGLSGKDGVLTYIYEETQEAARHAGMTALEAALTAAAKIDANPVPLPGSKEAGPRRPGLCRGPRHVPRGPHHRRSRAERRRDQHRRGAGPA